MPPVRPTLSQLESGVRAGQRARLAQAITLIESSRAQDQAEARALIQALLPLTGKAIRLGISGVPGVGKSTFIEALGMKLVEAGKRVAVLAVDPSSTVSGGSILGDKTRMARLGRAEQAFIRPSPTGTTLGGVARRTRESLLLCEAAGFDVVIVETVGVGQSEVHVAGMVDTFLVLMLPGAGDELQGIKKGILEIADILAVNKADGDTVVKAGIARRQLAAALHDVAPRSASWSPRVVTASALTGDGLDEVWALVGEHRSALLASGELEERRAEQALTWTWSLVEEAVLHALHQDPRVKTLGDALARKLRDGSTTPALAADQLLAAFLRR